MPRHLPEIVVRLPDTPSIREALLQLGGHAVDDEASFWEDEAEDAALDRAGVTRLRGRSERATSDEAEACDDRAGAYRTINDAILRALGLA